MKNNISNDRPHFFPNSKTAKKEQAIQKAKQLRNIQGNNQVRAKEIHSKTQHHAKVDIPPSVRDFARIKKAVDQAPPMDNSEKIAMLKAKIQKGEYQVDYDALAEKLLESEYWDEWFKNIPNGPKFYWYVE